MRIVFLGTPDFAVPSLTALAGSGHDIVAAVTQPDRINGSKVIESDVKKRALALGIPVLQYAKVSREGAEDLRALKPDLMVTCSFGQILSQEILDIAPLGVINVHGSLLPRHRGATPIQSSIIAGDTESGVTIMQTVKAVDAGDIILIERLPIAQDDTAGTLFDKLSLLGAEALLKAVAQIANGTATYTAQNDKEATYCRQFTKDSGKVDFSLTTSALSCFVRGMTPWPSAYTFWLGKRLKLLSVQAASVPEEYKDALCGTVLTADKSGLTVKTADGAARLIRLQPENKRAMTDTEFLLGYHPQVGTLLGE